MILLKTIFRLRKQIKELLIENNQNQLSLIKKEQTIENQSESFKKMFKEKERFESKYWDLMDEFERYKQKQINNEKI